LHHAYPFIVGMLTTLTIGTAIVLPGGTTGPLLMRAMREGEVTTRLCQVYVFGTRMGCIPGRDSQGL
jgi:hypothetical protein